MPVKKKVDAMALERVLVERAGWVNHEIDCRLPSIRPVKFYESLREYLDHSKNRVRPSMAVYEPIRHVVEAGGKRIRPTLCLLACEAVGGDPNAALGTAAAIEFIHTFTLIHDDVMDEDMVRRGRPTVAAIWGNPIAITAGDGLFALAFSSIADSADDPAVGPATTVRLVRMAAQACLDLSRGQTMDLLLEQDGHPTTDRYLEMIRLKTGVLLEFALKAGALLGGGSDAAIEAIGGFGAPLGMAFQIKDDLLDLTSTPEVLGKPVGSDIRRGKRTLMVVHALENASPTGAKKLLGILDRAEHKTDDAAVAEAVAVLEAAGSMAFAEAKANELVDQAKAALNSLPTSAAAESLAALHDMADFVIHRER